MWWSFEVCYWTDSNDSQHVCRAAGFAVSSQAVQSSGTCHHCSSPAVLHRHSQLEAYRQLTAWHSACTETRRPSVCFALIIFLKIIIQKFDSVVIPPYSSIGGYFVYCMFVCLYVRLWISQPRKKIAVWNFACWFDYCPGWVSPILVNFGLEPHRPKQQVSKEAAIWWDILADTLV